MFVKVKKGDVRNTVLRLRRTVNEFIDSIDQCIWIKQQDAAENRDKKKRKYNSLVKQINILKDIKNKLKDLSRLTDRYKDTKVSASLNKLGGTMEKLTWLKKSESEYGLREPEPTSTKTIELVNGMKFKLAIIKKGGAFKDYYEYAYVDDAKQKYVTSTYSGGRTGSGVSDIYDLNDSSFGKVEFIKFVE